MRLLEQVKAIEQRASKAAKGPWVSPWTEGARKDGIYNAEGVRVAGYLWYDGHYFAMLEEDAAFTVASRMDVPALCQALRVLGEAVKAELEYRQHACPQCEGMHLDGDYGCDDGAALAESMDAKLEAGERLLEEGLPCES